MIVGISGYMGSGKDTIAKIMQYLDYVEFMKSKLAEKERQKYLNTVNILSYEDWTKPIIHQSGYDISGISMYDVNNFGKSWKVVKWAGKLKEIASILTGIPIEKFEDQQFKNTNLGSEWSILKMKPGKRQDGIFPKKVDMISVPMTVRDFLQKLGTDAIREGLHPNTWVNALMADYKPGPDYQEGTTPENLKWKEGDFPNWIITDTRFPNEAEAIKNEGGIIIRVSKPTDPKEEIPATVKRHISETSLDNWKFDEYIVNHGTIDDLIIKVKDVLERRKIL